MLLRPGDDLLGVGDRRAVVELGHGHRRVARQLLRALTPGGLVGDAVGQYGQAVGENHLRGVASPAQGDEGVAAWMPAGTRRAERSPAHVELHGREPTAVTVQGVMPRVAV